MLEWISFPYCAFGSVELLSLPSPSSLNSPHPSGPRSYFTYSGSLTRLLFPVSLKFSLYFFFPFNQSYVALHLIIFVCQLRWDQGWTDGDHIFFPPQELGQHYLWAAGTQEMLVAWLVKWWSCWSGSEVKKLSEGYPLNAKLFGDYHVNADLPKMLI